MLPKATDRTWRWLVTAATEPAPPLDRSSFTGLPAPAERWLRHALPVTARLSTGVLLHMAGEMRIGRWMPFTAEQVLRAGVGFVWKPVVGGRLVRFVGADILGPQDARMEFRWQGLIPVAKASGPGTARSAIGRLAAETVAWLPQATTPQAGARWTPIDDERAIVSLQFDDEWTDVEINVDRDGRLRSVRLQRWNDSANPPALEPFGGDITRDHVTDDGVRIAGAGAIGWDYGTPAWTDGEFFRFAITAATPLDD